MNVNTLAEFCIKISWIFIVQRLKTDLIIERRNIEYMDPMKKQTCRKFSKWRSLNNISLYSISLFTYNFSTIICLLWESSALWARLPILRPSLWEDFIKRFEQTASASLYFITRPFSPVKGRFGNLEGRNVPIFTVRSARQYLSSSRPLCVLRSRSAYQIAGSNLGLFRVYFLCKLCA